MTQKTKTYRKANRLLGASALGLLAAYPFQHAFLGGLLVSGCTAALVGGLADWFAVNALFRRPLGIRPNRILRTDIIPRNREKIYDALAEMVQHELLSPQALQKKLTNHDFHGTLLKVWEGVDQETYREFLEPLLASLLNQLAEEGEGLEREVESLLSHKKVSRAFYSLLGQALYTLAESSEGEKALKELLYPVADWINSQEVKGWLIRWIEDAKTRYVNDQAMRKMLMQALPDTPELAARLQRYLEEQITTGPIPEAILTWVRGKSAELYMVGEKLGEGGNHFPELQEIGAPLIRTAGRYLQEALQTQIAAPETSRRLGRMLIHELERWLGELAVKPESKARFNTRVQNLVCETVDKQHEVIGKTVREGLERYSDERLVELIESKTGNDLQMIRINGSLVGGLVGMIIYILQL